MTIGALAERLEVTQQAVSKSVADLERRGYVARRPDPDDARAPGRSRSPNGARRRSPAAAVHRAAIAAELGERLGPRRVEGARRLLLDVLADLGADTAVRGRRVRPPR